MTRSAADKTRRARLLFGFLIVLAGVSGAKSFSRDGLPPGDYRFALEHQGRVRSYLAHVPPQAAYGRPLPVIVSFHGGGGTAQQHRAHTGMDVKADAAGFIAVYPDGSGRRNDRLLTWNAGHCCGYAQAQGVDDVGFVAALLDDLSRRAAVDEKRVYAVGFSNGAMMAYRVADRLPQRFAAAAAVAGAAAPDGAAGQRPVSILHIHSETDPRAHYAGGAGPYNFATAGRIVHEPVEASVRARALRYGCAFPPRQEAPLLGRGEEASHSAVRIVYAGCREGAELVLIRLKGPGHVWPGGRGGALRHRAGEETSVIDANDEIWRFFSRHRLP